MIGMFKKEHIVTIICNIEDKIMDEELTTPNRRNISELDAIKCGKLSVEYIMRKYPEIFVIQEACSLL